MKKWLIRYNRKKPPNVKYQDRFLIAYREARAKERVMVGMRTSVNLYCDYSNKQGNGLNKKYL